MGFLSKIFNVKVVNKTSRELLKEATSLKKSGDIHGAIESLRQAYQASKSEGVTFSADVYLRLPKYLYQAGKPDEAWSEYNRALAQGFNGETPSVEMAEINQSEIYGSMANQLTKEKKFYHAAVFQAASSLAWQRGMLIQHRKSELDVAALQNTIKKTLEKSDQKNASDQFLAIVMEAFEDPKQNQVKELIDHLYRLK